MGSIKHRLVETWGLNMATCLHWMVFPHSHHVDHQIRKLWNWERNVANVPHSSATQIEPVSE